MTRQRKPRTASTSAGVDDLAGRALGDDPPSRMAIRRVA
jgi:hypothetical protein